MGDALAQAILYVVLLIVFAIIAALIMTGRKWIEARRLEAEVTLRRFYERQGGEVRSLIDAAIRYGADFAESIDFDGQIELLMTEFKSKGEAKLYAAVDVACEWLEEQFKLHGYTVNVPEELIKTGIQNYVFNNRDRYPSSKEQHTQG